MKRIMLTLFLSAGCARPASMPGSTEVCADAARHLKECTGVDVGSLSGCDAAQAESALDLDCGTLASADPGKTDTIAGAALAPVVQAISAAIEKTVADQMIKYLDAEIANQVSAVVDHYVVDTVPDSVAQAGPDAVAAYVASVKAQYKTDITLKYQTDAVKWPYYIEFATDLDSLDVASQRAAEMRRAVGSSAELAPFALRTSSPGAPFQEQFAVVHRPCPVALDQALRTMVALALYDGNRNNPPVGTILKQQLGDQWLKVLALPGIVQTDRTHWDVFGTPDVDDVLQQTGCTTWK